MPFPLVKLGTIALRQASKPLASYIQSQAQNKPSFRRLCARLANYYRSFENGTNRLFYEVKPKKVKPITEEHAVRLGSTLVGEAFLFTVAATALTYEYVKSSQKVQSKELELNNRIQRLEVTTPVVFHPHIYEYRIKYVCCRAHDERIWLRKFIIMSSIKLTAF